MVYPFSLKTDNRPNRWQRIRVGLNRGKRLEHCQDTLVVIHVAEEKQDDVGRGSRLSSYQDKAEPSPTRERRRGISDTDPSTRTSLLKPEMSLSRRVGGCPGSGPTMTSLSALPRC